MKHLIEIKTGEPAKPLTRADLAIVQAIARELGYAYSRLATYERILQRHTDPRDANLLQRVIAEIRAARTTRGVQAEAHTLQAAAGWHEIMQREETRQAGRIGGSRPKRRRQRRRRADDKAGTRRRVDALLKKGKGRAAAIAKIARDDHIAPRSVARRLARIGRIFSDN